MPYTNISELPDNVKRKPKPLHILKHTGSVKFSSDWSPCKKSSDNPTKERFCFDLMGMTHFTQYI
jgi:cation transport regulator ChaB